MEKKKGLVCRYCKKEYTDEVDKLAVELWGFCLMCDKNMNYTEKERLAQDIAYGE